MTWACLTSTQSLVTAMTEPVIGCWLSPLAFGVVTALFAMVVYVIVRLCLISAYRQGLVHVIGWLAAIGTVIYAVWLRGSYCG